MTKKIVVAALALGAMVIAVACIMYAKNAAPAVREISSAEAAEFGKPFVVKLHAQWCANCMLTKSVWSQIEQAYSSRAHLVVFDFTNNATTEASRTRAKRIGLEKFLEEHGGDTGTIAVLDGRTKKTTAVINGSRDFAEYRAAIDASLKGAVR
jgi:hypothetical protein